MGLYIPDLRLPIDGDFELWIAVKKDGSFTYNVRGSWQDGKQKAILVLPHGKLIDVDALSNTVEQHYKHLKINRYDRDLLLYYLDVEMAPTIISAEPPKEE